MSNFPAYGADPSRYQLIPRVLLIVTHEEKVLLIRRSERKRLWPGKYNAPGGHVERGEDPYAAGARELEEETGLIAGPLELRGLIVAETDLPGSGILVFIYRTEAAETTTRSGSEGEAAWVARSEMGQLDLLPDLAQILELTLDQPHFFYLYKIPNADGSEQTNVRIVEAKILF